MRRTCAVAGRKISLFLAFLCPLLGAAESRVTGAVTDSVSSAIPGAAAQLRGGGRAYRAESNAAGEFQFENLTPGEYSLSIRKLGFRERFIEKLEVPEGKSIQLGTLRLAVGSCDSPGVVCTSIAATGLSDTYGAREHLTLRPSCGVTFSSGQIDCGDFPSSSASARLSAHGGHVLESVNGSQIGVQGPSRSDCVGVKFETRGLPLDGHGPGFDFCVRADRRIWHVFLREEVLAESPQVDLWYISRD